MNELQKRELKRRLVALTLAGTLLSSAGCTNNNSENNEVPNTYPIDTEYNKFDEYYKYSIRNGEAVKFYKTEYIYLLIDKNTYEVKEYIYASKDILGGLGRSGELYNIETGELLFYCDGISDTYNEEYFCYLKENNYEVCMKDLSDYVEGKEVKEWYCLEEISSFETQIVESLKIINRAKTKTLN